MDRPPDISVVLPVYNGEKYLEDSIASIQQQTVQDFELIVIDDGSTDNTEEIIHRLERRDPRIKGLKNHTNIGIARSLNRGLDGATGRYIARQDADDLSMPGRLSEQSNFLDAYPEVGVVGSAMAVIDRQGKQIRVYRQPETDMQIRFRLLFNCPFVHTSVMMRRSVIVKNGLAYDAGFFHAEDYQFWTRFLSCSTGYNFQIPLVKYRLSAGGISSTHPLEQASSAERISCSQMALLEKGFTPPSKDKAVMLELYRRYLVSECHELSRDERQVIPALYQLVAGFMEKHQCRDKSLMSFKGFLLENLSTARGNGFYDMISFLESAVSGSLITRKMRLQFPNSMARLHNLIWKFYHKTNPRADR